MLLTAFLGALSSASLMVQTNVYSLNAVGYINVTCAPGFNMIADQLQATNNTLAGLIVDSSGYIDGLTIYKWNGTSFSEDFADSGNPPTYWDNNGTITLNPGEACWLKNPFKTNLTFTFVGTVPQGTLTNNILGPGKFTMVSSQVPQSGDLMTVLGFTNSSGAGLANNGDKIYVWNNTTGTGSYTTYTSDFGGGAGYQQNWDPPGDPTVNVGQGFWYQTAPASIGGAAITWVRTFSVNQ